MLVTDLWLTRQNAVAVALAALVLLLLQLPYSTEFDGYDDDETVKVGAGVVDAV